MATETEAQPLRGRAARTKRRQLERKITIALQEQIRQDVHDNIEKLIAIIAQGGMLQASIQVALPTKQEIDQFTGQVITTPQTPGE